MVFKEYKYKAVPVSRESALAGSNGRCFSYTSPLKLTNMLNVYEYFIAKVSSMPHLNFVSVGELMKDPPANVKNKVRVLLRHDIDHDLVAALMMREIEKEFGLSGYYLLHHASPYYYGVFDENLVFNRNESLADVYLELQSSGAEVGLHIDPFTIYKLGVDGSEAIVCELAWLRSIGLRISSVSAHGSAPYYGAEAFEIFKEWRLYKNDFVSSDGANSMSLGLFPLSKDACAKFSNSNALPQTVNLPLGVLSAKELELKLEANFASPVHNANKAKIKEYFQRAKTEDMKTYLYYYLHRNAYSQWGQDYTVWLYGMDRWAISSTDPNGYFRPDASTLEVIKFLDELSGEEKVVLHIHPIYFGFRIFPGLKPFKISCSRDEYAIDGSIFIQDINRITKMLEKSTDYGDYEMTIKHLTNKIDKLEEEVFHWRRRAKSPGKFIGYNLKRLLKK